jgi:hypothetical protein
MRNKFEGTSERVTQVCRRYAFAGQTQMVRTPNEKIALIERACARETQLFRECK